MLPNFLHVGAAKAASSWLWRVCLEHPDIYVPEQPDNVNFFTVSFHRGLVWYERTYFAGYAGEPAVGEFSNSYMVYEPALQRIARYLPEARLVMTLRHPVDRAYLQWAHIHLKNKPYGLDPARGIELPLDKVVHHHGHSWFRLWIEPGMYAFLLERIHRYFRPDQVLVTFYDDLRDRPRQYLRLLFDFLDVDAAFESSWIGKPVNPDAPEADPVKGMDAELRAELIEIYRDDVLKLQDMIGRDLSGWLK